MGAVVEVALGGAAVNVAIGGGAAVNVSEGGGAVCVGALAGAQSVTSTASAMQKQNFPSMSFIGLHLRSDSMNSSEISISQFKEKYADTRTNSDGFLKKENRAW